MIVTFRRVGRVCAWSALRPPRTVVPGPSMAAGGDLPHDLYTFVIEQALGIEHGFWGCVADGATFKTLGRKRTPQGREVISRHLRDLDESEFRVNDIYFAWKTGTPTPLDAGGRLLVVDPGRVGGRTVGVLRRVALAARRPTSAGGVTCVQRGDRGSRRAGPPGGVHHVGWRNPDRLHPPNG